MDLLDEALERFNGLLKQAINSEVREPTAMSLATAGVDSKPTVRTVLLKKVNRDGFVFYTNRNSRKGQHIARNPQAALCFYWHEAHEQVQVEGKIILVPDHEADDYWITRGRASQIGAWASRQSQVLESRDILLQRVKEFEGKFDSQDVPRPEFWGGYRLIPELIEFWHGHPDRLNQRLRYTLLNNEWVKQEIYP